MIREATLSDLPYFMRAAHDFVQATPLSLDPESYLNNVIELIYNDDAMIYTTGSGHCAVILVPSLYDSEQIIAKIITTWGRGGLQCFRAAVKWAAEQGASLLMADSYIEPRIEKFYERFGMIRADNVYMKVI